MKKTGSEDRMEASIEVQRYRHITKCCQLFEELLTEKVSKSPATKTVQDSRGKDQS
jgi:hypothetical protein